MSLGVGEKVVLADNISADGTAKHLQVGGTWEWIVQGSFDAGDELKLQCLLPDGATYADKVGAVLAANGFMSLNFPNGTTVKIVVINTPTNFTSWLVRH